MKRCLLDVSGADNRTKLKGIHHENEKVIGVGCWGGGGRIIEQETDPPAVRTGLVELRAVCFQERSSRCGFYYRAVLVARDVGREVLKSCRPGFNRLVLDFPAAVVGRFASATSSRE